MYLFFYFLPLRVGGMGLVKNTHQPHNTPWRDPHQQHSVHMHTITHQCSNHLKVPSTCPYHSISVTSRYLSNSNLNVSPFSVVPIWLPHHKTYDVIIIIKDYTWLLAPMLKISSQFDKRLRRKIRKFCADKKKETDRLTKKRDANLSHRLKVILPKRKIFISSMTSAKVFHRQTSGKH